MSILTLESSKLFQELYKKRTESQNHAQQLRIYPEAILVFILVRFQKNPAFINFDPFILQNKLWQKKLWSVALNNRISLWPYGHSALSTVVEVGRWQCSK